MKLFFKTILLFALILSSCRVSLVPDYNANIYQQIISAASRNDRIYIDLLQANPDDRKFSLYAKRYASLETAIQSIYLQYQARPHANSFLPIIENIQTLFVKFKNEHQSQSAPLSADQVRLYQQYARDYWKPLLIAENALK